MQAPTDTSWQSNSLAEIAARIREEHEASEAAQSAAVVAARKGIEHAMACGDALIQARSLVPYGQWLPWLAENCPAVSERTARLYMQLAGGRTTLDAQIGNQGCAVADLTLQEAARLLTPDEPEPDPKKPKPKPRPPKPDPLTKDVTGEQLRILIGDCRERLRDLPEKSIHCCITSPPYFGLRSFDVEPSKWGGDTACVHDWSDHERPGISGGTKSETRQIKGKDNFQIVASSEYSICCKCGAWRGCLGLEPTPELYVEHIAEVFDDVWRVLRDDGTAWIVIGDCYNMKDLCMIPARVALALQARGWYLRSDICWQKTNTTPESVTDRPTKSYEHVLLLTKRPDYYYAHEAIKEPAVSIADPRKGDRRTYNGKNGNKAFVSISEDNKRNARDVWTISSEPYAGEHFAPFPPALVKPMVLSGTSEVGCCSKCGAPWKREVERTATPKATTIDWSPSCSCGDAGLVPCTLLDPFAGVGTTALVANALGRKAVLIEANATYAAMAQERIDKELPEYTARANSTDAWGAVIVDGTGDISTTSNAERLIHLIDEIVTEQ